MGSVKNKTLKLILPPAGLPIKGLRKKHKVNHTLSKKENSLDMFFLQAAKQNCRNWDTAALTLNRWFSLFNLHLMDCPNAMEIQNSRFWQILRGQKNFLYLGII